MTQEMIKIRGNEVIITPLNNEVWLTLHELARFFECYTSKIRSNVRSILKSGVLDGANVCRTYHYENGSLGEQYNLEMITALSFRIQSRNAELFRNFIIKAAIANTTGKTILMIGDWNKKKNCNIFLN